jgi:hypothetical protein
MSNMGEYACRSDLDSGPGKSLINNATSSSIGAEESPVVATEALAGGESCNRR